MIKSDSDNDFLDDDAKWLGVQNRDEKLDQKYVYCVKTTGVYCRPSCTSRRPRRENVIFVESVEHAQALGFRPCKRCGDSAAHIQKRNITVVAKVCRLLESSEDKADIEPLLSRMGMSRSHFQRIFKSVTGITPKSYQSSARARRVAEALPHAKTVTEAIHSSGFTSNGRFYSDSNKILGMTPTQYRNRGAETTIQFAIGECSLGSILVASTEKGVCAISLGHDPDLLIEQLQDSFPNADLIGGNDTFERLVSQVVGYIENPSQHLDLPLDIRGTVFQTKVWAALKKIPTGTTVSYSTIANQIGSPKSIRAVAKACAANKIAFAIPCHRVIRTDGGISGYRWGVERKQEILKREKAARESQQSQLD